jgi:hypothetical protein
MDTEKIKDAFTDFENDDFIAAGEKIKAEVHTAVNTYIETKAGLEKGIDPKPEPDKEPEPEDGEVKLPQKKKTKSNRL